MSRMTILNRDAVCLLIFPNWQVCPFRPVALAGNISVNRKLEVTMVISCNKVYSRRGQANEYAC